MRYHLATLSDLPLLVESRILVLRAANQLPEDADLLHLKVSSESYYRQALKDGSHVAFLVFDREQLVGTGGVSFFSVMPTYCNPSGKKAYIMNMYTRPDYRRQGIAKETLSRLVQIAQQQKAGQILLEATEIGRSLYEAAGFVSMKHEMEWKNL